MTPIATVYVQRQWKHSIPSWIVGPFPVSTEVPICRCSLGWGKPTWLPTVSLHLYWGNSKVRCLWELNPCLDVHCRQCLPDSEIAQDIRGLQSVVIQSTLIPATVTALTQNTGLISYASVLMSPPPANNHQQTAPSHRSSKLQTSGPPLWTAMPFMDAKLINRQLLPRSSIWRGRLSRADRGDT